ncbi:MAG TPA: hypothetical protein VFR84_01800 [Candidatus Angelobacter sp.]|nr:hypothetical protein [Candidatus Angelobacter sp.]
MSRQDEKSEKLSQDPEEVKKGLERLVRAWGQSENPEIRKRLIADEIRKIRAEKRRRLN